MIKKCSVCNIQVGKNSRRLLCQKHREKLWVMNNRKRSNEIKKKYALKNKEKRKISLKSYRDKPSSKNLKHNWYITTKKNNYCPDCDKKIYFKSNYCASCFQRGERASNWQGGITPILRAQRNSIKKWSIQVRKRDGKCILCSSTQNLHADHIKPFSLYPELRNDLTNGRTLCASCHYKTDTFGGRISHA